MSESPETTTDTARIRADRGSNRPATLASPALDATFPDSAAPLYTRSFALAFVSQVGFTLANMLMSHYSRWIDFLGGDVEDVGWIMGAGAIGGLLLRPWMGQWINRFGARTVWMLGYAVFALGSLGNLLLWDLDWPIYVLRACLVLGPAFVFSSSLTYITQSAPADRQAEAIGTLGMAGFLGMLIGPYLGDLILGSGMRTRGDFSVLFVGAAGALIVPAVALLFVQDPVPSNRDSAVRLRDFIRTVREFWPGMILLVTLAFGICMTVPFVFLAKYVDEFQLSGPGRSGVGLFFLCYAGIGLFTRITLRTVPDRIGRRKVLIAGGLLMSAGMFTLPLIEVGQTRLLILPGLLTGLGHALMFHTSTSLVLEYFPVNVRGTGAALSLMVLDLGMIAGSPLLGTIADRWSYGAMYATVGGSCLCASLIYAASRFLGPTADLPDLKNRS